MPRLPTPQESLGGIPSARSGAPIARFDTSAIGRGAAHLGAELTAAAEVVRANWDTVRASETESRFDAWRFEEAKRYDQAVRSMKPGAAEGFADTYATGYAERAKAFKETIPERLKPDFDNRLFDYERTLYADSLNVERGELRRHSIATLDDAVRTIFLPKVDMAAKLPADDPRKESLLGEAEEAALKAIDANPALTPIEKDEQRRKVREVLQTAFARALPPEEQVYVDPNAPTQTIGERIRAVESGGNLTAANPQSSALGPDQFLKGTWLGLVRKYRPDIRGTNEQLLALRTDDALSAEMRDRYAQENATFLGARGYAATPGNIYLAHFLGPAGAVAMLGTDPGTSAAVVNPGAARANPTVFYRGGDPNQPRSAGEIVAWASARMAGTRYTDWGRRLNAVPHETKVAIAVDGSAAMTSQYAARQKAEKAAYDAQLNAAKNGVLDGTFGLTDVLTAYGGGTGWLTEATDRAALVSMIEERDRARLDFATASARVSDGSYQFNPFNDEDRKAANTYYDNGKAGSGGQGLLQEDPAAVNGLRAIIERSGVVPESAVAVIQGGLWSKSGAERQAAFSILDGLYRENPVAVTRDFSKEDLDRLQDYQALAPMLPPDELAQHMDPALNPAEMKRRQELRSEGAKLAAEVPMGEILDAFDPGVWTTGPSEPTDPMMSLTLRHDFDALFAERYAVSGKVDLAKTQAFERMAGKWGVTEIGGANERGGLFAAGAGPYLVPYPPEKYYPVVNGSHDWMDDQLEEFVLQTVPDAQSWQVISTAATEGAVGAKSAQVPYAIGVINADGVFEIISTQAVFDYDKARVEAVKRFEEKRARALAPPPAGTDDLGILPGLGPTGAPDPLDMPPPGMGGGGVALPR